MKDKVEKRVSAVFLLVLAVLVMVASVALSNIRRSIASSDWVNHTHAVILEAEAITSALHTGDAALRDYLLSGDPRDQSAYRGAYAEMVEHLELAQALTRSDTPAQQQLAELKLLLARRVDFARDLVKVREQQGLEGARQALNAEAGLETVLKIRPLVTRLKDEQNNLLRERDKASYAQAQTARWTVLAGVALNFLLLAFVAWLIRDDLGARRRAAATLQVANEQLEIKVQERTADLAQANQALQEENLERTWANQSSEHQLRFSQLIIDSISDLIFVVGKALNIVRVNPAAVHRTGLEAHELIGTAFHRVVRLAQTGPPGTKLDPVSMALKEGREIQNCPAVLLDKQGQATPVCLNLFPLRDRDKVVGGVITLRVL
jgi:PAS domain S-box-containing protein